MKKFIEVKQRGYKDCACACLLSLIKYYGGDVSYDELCILLQIDTNGTNAYNIINIAKNFGFGGYGLKCNIDELCDSFKYPCIVHVLNNNYYHFMILYEINNKEICTLMDPDKGIIKLSKNELNEIFLGTIIVLYPIKKIIKTKSIKTFFKYLCNLLLDFKIQIINIFILSIVLVILTFISNFYLKILLERYLTFNKLLIISVVFFDILVIKNIISFIRNRCLIFFNKKINTIINNDMITHIFNLPYLFFKNKSSGEIISRVHDLNNFKLLISELVSGVFLDLLILVSSLIVMIFINIYLFYITISFSFIYFIIEIIFKNKFKYYISKYKEEYTHYNIMLSNYINGYESIKNLDMINYMCGKLSINYKKSLNTYEVFNNYLSGQLFVRNVCIDLLYLFIVFFGYIFVYDSDLVLSNLILFIAILSLYLGSLKNVLGIIPRFYECRDLYNRLNDILVIESNSYEKSFNKIYGDIRIDNISYSYNGVDKVFENLCIDIKYGSCVLIFGNSGIGKSTIFKLLLKYLDGYEGSIIINNNDLNDISNSIIAKSFTYVSQNEYLINDTLKNNIIFFRNIDDKYYNDVIKICNLEEFINNNNFKDNVLIEDNGFNISGGQKQKIILARALLKDSNYIILDEALSEVSFEEEKLILKNIKEYFYNKTIIYSSHKNELINEFDKVYYLERRG